MGTQRDRPYRMRRNAGREQKTDVVAFALTAQTVIIVIMLLFVFAVKLTANEKYKGFKEQYGVMLSSKSEAEKLLSSGNGAASGIIKAVRNFYDAIFGAGDKTHNNGGEARLTEPGADAVEYEPLETKQAAFKPKLFDPGNFFIEDNAAKSGGEKNGVLYLKAHTGGGEIFPAEIMRSLGEMPVPRGASISPVYLSPPMIPPLSGVITSGFSLREHPISGEDHFHRAIDIAADEGEDIVAAMSGVVKGSGVSETYGNYITLAHSGGLETSYSHCSEIFAKPGVLVRQGERIARVGSTGVTTGPHLHFAVLRNGEYTDPAKLLSDYIEVLK